MTEILKKHDILNAIDELKINDQIKCVHINFHHSWRIILVMIFKDKPKYPISQLLFIIQIRAVTKIYPGRFPDDPDVFMKTHLNDENFKGEIQERFEK